MSLPEPLKEKPKLQVPLPKAILTVIVLDPGWATSGLQVLLNYNSHYPLPLTMLAGVDGRTSGDTQMFSIPVQMFTRETEEAGQKGRAVAPSTIGSSPQFMFSTGKKWFPIPGSLTYYLNNLMQNASYLNDLLGDLPGLVNIQRYLGIPYKRMKRSSFAEAKADVGRQLS